MRKMLLMFAVMFSYMGGWAQTYQKVPHSKWIVTALNEAGTSGNEGGLSFLLDENPETFYHSNYSAKYEGRSEKFKGQDGLQAFMVDMAEVVAFDRLTYTGRSDKSANWATKVRVYIFDNLPSEWPKNGENYKALNTLNYDEKEELLKKESNTVLGAPAFDNNVTGTWAEDRNVKTIEFATPQTGKYILFVADATTGGNGYFTCSDFHVWQKVDGIVADKPYYLKIKDLDNYYLDTRVGASSDYGNTICKTQTPVATYFTLNDGYWHISSLPGNEFKFVNITQWDAIPASIEPANWTLHEVEEGFWSLAQSTYYGNNESANHYLGANDGNISGNSKVYTDKLISQAVKFELIELTEEERAVEEVRAAEGRVNAAREIAQQVLGKIGVGYPAPGSEVRATLQAAIDNEEATVESIYSAIDAYNAVTDVVLPEAGKVYRLTSAYSAFTSEKALYSDNTQLKWGDKNTSAMNQLWVVQNISGNNLTLMNVGDAMYPQVSGFTAQVRMLHVKNESSLNALGAGKFRVMANKAQSMFPDNHGNGAGSGGTISNVNYEQAQWYFEEVAISKEILTAQVNSIKTAYVGSLLLKEEGVSNLRNATEVAEAVCNTDNGDYTTAFAQLIEAVNDATIEYIDLGYFYMKSKDGNKYAYNDGNNLKAADAKTCKSIFKLTKANNGTFYVQNGNGYYAQNVAQSAQTVIGSSAVEYTISRLSTNHYVLRPKNSTGQYQFWHQDGSNNIVGWETVGGNTQWTFEPLNEEEVEKIYTVNLATCDASHYLSYTGEYAGDKDVKANGGFYVLDAVPTETDLNVQNLGDYASSVNIDAIQRNIKVVTGVDNSSIYILRCLKDNAYARYHSGCQLSADDKTNMMTWQGGMVMESLFYIEEGTDEYAGFYTIRSYAAPTMYAYNLGTDNANSKVAMKVAPTEGGLTGEYYWKITYRNENGTPANITPYHEGGNTGDNYGWNKRGAYDGKNHIGYWHESDKDCNATSDNKWYVRTVEEELTALGKLPLPQYTSDNSVIGLATYESVEPVIGFEDVVNASGLTSFQNIAAYVPVVPKAGTFFKLKNEASGNYMTATSGTSEGSVKVKATPTVESIFYVDKDSTLLSYAFGRYLDCEDKKLSDVGTKHGGIYHGAQVYGYKENILMYRNNSHWTYGNKADEEAIDRGSSMPNNDKGYNWIFEPVTEIPVTISAVKYATFYAPCNVTLPEGLTAYYVSNVDNGYATLTEVDGNVVPANTGVLLNGNANTYNLTIGGQATEIENKLTGTVASEYINTTSYVLAKDVEGLGFYKASKNFAESDNGTFTKVDEGGTHFLNNGFKAYLPANVVPSDARFLSFDFGNETAIENIEGAENGANAVIYDLSGRRVQKVQKGLYIVNGAVVIK